MAGVEKTWAGRVRLGMKVVMIELSVVVEMMVDVLMLVFAFVFNSCCASHTPYP